MSSLSWIDFDQSERDRIQRIMTLYKETDTRDELGLGSIRDSIADTLFPGTSTIQTRLRYVLFVAWIYRDLESSKSQGNKLRAEARRHEVALIQALKNGGETTGIIGREAGDKIQRLPSSVYWAALQAWGIRRFHGSVESMLDTYENNASRPNPNLDVEAAGSSEHQSFWNDDLPKTPDNLYLETNFILTSHEADFIRLQLLRNRSSSLLSFLANNRSSNECEFIWEHPLLDQFSSENRCIVDHARRFSLLMHGASLLYNLMLSKNKNKNKNKNQNDWEQKYESRIAEWRSAIDLRGISDWNLDDFWIETQHADHKIRPATKAFVESWKSLVIANQDISENRTACELIKRREQNLKGAQSRFLSQSALDRWSGASGTTRLNFRWPQARSHLKDINVGR